jgi:hypothetical protein
MQVDLETLAELYASKTDEELLALAADTDSLIEGAGAVLSDELQRRNLTGERVARIAAEAAPASITANESLAGSLVTLGLMVLVLSFMLKAFGVPLAVNLPVTLCVFLFRYYTSIRASNR